MATECAICFEDLTAATGHSTLGCGHTFHLRCVVAWFQEQECASSCPCCRRAVGELDNVPLYPDDEEDGEDDDDESEASDDSSSVDSIEREIEQLLDASPAEEEQWVRATSGRWHLDGMRYISWGIEDRNPPPRTLVATMKGAATKVQALWRGHQIRRPVVGENE
jgi:hypothetical protein